MCVCTENGSQQLQMSRASMCTRGICTARLYILLLFLYTRVYLTRVGETRLIRRDVYTGRSTDSCSLSLSCPSTHNIISKNLITAYYNVYKVILTSDLLSPSQ